MNVSFNTPHFTDENHAVWSEIIKNKEIFFKEYANFIYQPYLDGFRQLGLNADQLPTIELLTEALSPSGWKPIFVNGYLPTEVYIDLVSKKQIPISSYMRSLQHIEYAPAPDLIHDLIGHLPMLFFSDYVEYLLDLCECFSLVEPNIYDAQVYEAQKKLARLGDEPRNEERILLAKNALNNAEKALRENPSSQYKLDKLFLWTIEFGLIKSHSIPKLYGAGLMSSSLEAEAICQGNIKIFPFSLEDMMKDFHFSDLQDQVFVADSFQSLRENLAKFKHKIVA